MTQKKRRFFSGPSLPAALVAAASEHGLQPEEIEYRLIEKKHGFLKVRRNVVIEVDPDAPRKTSPTEAAPPTEAEGAAAPPPEASPETGGTGREAEAAEPSTAETAAAEAGQPPIPEPEPEPEELPRLRPRRRPEREEREERDDRETRRPGVRQRFSEEPPAAPPRVRQPPEPEPRPSAAPRRETPAPPSAPPLPIEKRCRKATGELADCALEAVEWLLDLVDLDVDPLIYEGDERLEIELRGPDREALIADSGKALAALEHLVPRVMRGVCGQAYPCRVDSENYQELREERLRDTALEIAARVRHEGRAEILEPMDPADRRIIHVTLSDDESVTTRSLGEGFFKRVKILPAD
jgi:spoIIIJ-associated protein